jgi:hypothetical protein
MADKKKQPSSPISVEKAKDHALFALRSNWAWDVYGFEKGDVVALEKKPLIIHDLNGQELFYEFGVIDGKTPVGSVKTSASKAIGSAVPQIQLGPRRWDPDYAFNKVKAKIKEEYQRAKIEEVELVCYSYPKIGVRIHTGDGEGMIFDVASLSLVDRFGSDELEGQTSWSFYNEIVEPEAAIREKRWELEDRYLMAAKSAIPEIVAGELGAKKKDIKTALNEVYKSITPVYPTPIPPVPIISQKLIQFSPRCTTHNCYALYAQQTNYYCAVATGQMILDFYRYYYTQDEIAVAMGTSSTGTSNSGQVNGYEKLSNYCLDAEYDTTANWAEAKAEINANRPLKSGISGHARACFGWKRTIIIFPQKRWLYILDPWPWNADICSGGAMYWEDWDAITHTNFIYVRPRTTPWK